MFWMIIAGMTNSAVCFVECTLASLYKNRIDGEYRGGGPYCAARGLGWKKYAAFSYGSDLHDWYILLHAGGSYIHHLRRLPQRDRRSHVGRSASPVALLLALIVIGGIKRISAIASMVVPFMTIVVYDYYSDYSDCPYW